MMSSTAAAIGAEAFPAPTTTTRCKRRRSYAALSTTSESPSRRTNRRTARPGSTAASAAARTLSSGCLTSRGHVDRFAAGQFGGNVPICGQEPLEVALDDVGRDQAVASDAQASWDPRALADHGDARLQVARLRPVRPRVLT